MDFENVDTIKAFGMIFLGAVVARVLFYAYQGVRPKLLNAVSFGAPPPQYPNYPPVSAQSSGPVALAAAAPSVAPTLGV
jgi:hypothetical protein